MDLDQLRTEIERKIGELRELQKEHTELQQKYHDQLTQIQSLEDTVRALKEQNFELAQKVPG